MNKEIPFQLTREQSYAFELASREITKEFKEYRRRHGYGEYSHNTVKEKKS
jgi:hypothetical protein